MKARSGWLTFVLCVVLVLAGRAAALAQAGFDDDRVMLQGFYWESYRHGNMPEYGDQKWYDIVRKQAERIREGRFDLIWLPPPSFAGKGSAGYNPKEYFNLNNSYGNFDQHRAMLQTLWNNGVEPLADVVINHRDGSVGCAGFRNPEWDTRSICRSDEAFRNPASEVHDTPFDQRGAEEERPLPYANHGGTTHEYDSFRDLDHTNPQVRRDLLRHLLQLKSMGYRGWRYDMVHGYHARWVALYNKHSRPTFSVGEYDWGRHGDQRGWVWYTATEAGNLRSASSVFDFSTHFALRDNKANYPAWYGFGNGLGMMGDNTDGIAWKNRAVTFLENHDTGFRTEEDGTPQEHHEFDSFANNWQVEQAYAYILTHPGVPCVYWKHYFDWSDELRAKIVALINARKVADVHAGSPLHLQNNARAKGMYAALVEGRKGHLYVRIGGHDGNWQPSHSNYRDYREYAHGADWTVWIWLPGNPAVQHAPLNDPLSEPFPEYRDPAEIEVPDEWLGQ
jgi:alpha-amylase